jgi:hypothetical protein
MLVVYATTMHRGFSPRERRSIVEKKMTKKVMKLSSETLCLLERKEAEGVAEPKTPASGIGCCP